MKRGADDIVVIKDGSRYYAVAGKCTHMGGPLSDGLVNNGEIRCPWHHARFCYKTGEAVAAPALTPLQRFETQVRAGKLYLQGPKEPSSPARRKKSTEKIVIVGGGAGGFACADMLGRLGFQGHLTVVNADPAGSYDRTACSKDYLAGKMKRASCMLESENAYRDIHWLKGRTATVLDIKARAVIVDSGERISFDRCVLAMGAEPQRPSLAAWDSERVCMLRTLDDAGAIIKRAARAKSVVILGSSFIALEAAASLRQRRLRVHVVAPGALPLQQQFGPDVAAMIKQLHQDHGVQFHLRRRLVSYQAKTVRLDDGSHFKADFMVLGTGVKPRLDLARDAGLDIANSEDGGGVIVDSRLETSERGIIAIGDIASYPDRLAGKRIRVEHWVHAQRQGQYAARLIMGHRGTYDEIPFFWSAHYDQSLSYIGHVQKPLHPRLAGRIGAKNFALRFSDPSGARALLTCQRDIDSLKTEARWSQRKNPPRRR